MRFLVVGELMQDVYHRGRIERLNPESHAAPLLRCFGTVSRPGGAGNVAENIKAMGAEASLACQGYGTIIKNRLLDAVDGVVARFDVEDDCLPVSAEKLQDTAAGCAAVLVADYGKGAIDDATASTINSLHLPTFVDAKVRPDRWADWAEAMFPNEAEYIRHRRDYGRAETVIVKCGASGAKLLLHGSQCGRTFPSFVTKVRNVAGAGDTVLAAFAAVYTALKDHRDFVGAKQSRLQFSLELAMRFAGVAVSDPLTCAPSFRDVCGANRSGVLQEVAEALAK